MVNSHAHRKQRHPRETVGFMSTIKAFSCAEIEQEAAVRDRVNAQLIALSKLDENNKYQVMPPAHWKSMANCNRDQLRCNRRYLCPWCHSREVTGIWARVRDLYREGYTVVSLLREDCDLWAPWRRLSCVNLDGGCVVYRRIGTTPTDSNLRARIHRIVLTQTADVFDRFAAGVKGMRRVGAGQLSEDEFCEWFSTVMGFSFPLHTLPAEEIYKLLLARQRTRCSVTALAGRLRNAAPRFLFDAMEGSLWENFADWLVTNETRLRELYPDFDDVRAAAVTATAAAVDAV